MDVSWLVQLQTAFTPLRDNGSAILAFSLRNVGLELSKRITPHLCVRLNVEENCLKVAYIAVAHLHQFLPMRLHTGHPLMGQIRFRRKMFRHRLRCSFGCVRINSVIHFVPFRKCVAQKFPS
jgi:hypothetical protein